MHATSRNRLREEPAPDVAEEEAAEPERCCEPWKNRPLKNLLAEEAVTEDAEPADGGSGSHGRTRRKNPSGGIVVEEPAAEEPAAEAEQAEPEAQAIETPEADVKTTKRLKSGNDRKRLRQADEAAPEVYGMIPYTDTAGGAILFAVMDGSPADEAGLQMGDVILGVDGERLQRATDLADIVDAQTPGTGNDAQRPAPHWRV